MTADLPKEAREPLDDARKLLSVPVEEWTRGSAEIAEGIVSAYVDNVPALLARAALAKQLFNGVRLFLVAHQMAQPKPARQPKGEPDIITLPGQAE